MQLCTAHSIAAHAIAKLPHYTLAKTWSKDPFLSGNRPAYTFNYAICAKILQHCCSSNWGILRVIQLTHTLAKNNIIEICTTTENSVALAIEKFSSYTFWSTQDDDINWNTAHSQHSAALLWQLRNSHCAHFTHSPRGKKYCKQRQRCHDIWEILISQVEAECR